MILTMDERRKVENTANEFMASHNAIRPPVDVENLANKLGLRVERVEFDDDRKEGYIDPTTKLLAINKQLSPRRARSVIAHEIGHIELEHAGVSFCLRGGRSTKEELAADYFARIILMPERLMRIAVDYFNTNNNDVKSFDSLQIFISRLFDVAEDKALIRLMELGVE